MVQDAIKAPQYIFDFQKELLSYCESDVLLLKGACEVICKDFEEISGFNPLQRRLTSASACNLYYRTTHMQERTIASEPLNGWHGEGKQFSRVAIERLTYLNNRTDGCYNIIQGRNGGEYLIRDGDKKIYIDGYE